MPVLSEITTMTEVAQGTSLARFGHGEMLIMAGEDAAYQKFDGQLSFELQQILNDSPCLQAIPPGRYQPPEWKGFLDKYQRLVEADRWYGSSFVSRHDWVSWTKEYRKLLFGLWKNRIVTLVSHNRMELRKASWIRVWVETPRQNAFDEIGRLESQAETIASDIVILSCGPAGTVLADRLARKGIWAVDLGNFGKFL